MKNSLIHDILIISVTTDVNVFLSRFKISSVQLQGSAHAASVGVE